MKIFIDTANVDEIKRANELGVICGVTTNPSLIAREGRDFVEVIKEICQIIDGPVSAEVVSLKAEEMVAEACDLYEKIASDNVIIKIPMCAEGLKATKRLTELGIKTNVTLVFSTAQALLAARAGATYVSPFVGRLDDIGDDGISLVKDIVDIFRGYDIKTQIIAASIRTSAHITNAARAGSDIATVPYKVIDSMISHPLTTSGIERFLADWATVESK